MMLKEILPMKSEIPQIDEKVLSEFKIPEIDYKNAVKEQLETIKTTPLESLRAINEQMTLERLNSKHPDLEALSVQVDDTKKLLTEEEKEKIKEETGWSDEIIDAIESWEEYEIYRDAGLREMEINGKKCLVRDDIDWEQKDSMGRTNKERVEQGLSPINKDGKIIELHHLGQKKDAPLVELTDQEHRGAGNDSVLHDKTKDSEINRGEFAKERNEHWKSRVD